MIRRTHSPKTRESVLERYDYCCAVCKQKLSGMARPEFDHILPLGLGGDDEPENLQPLCKKCHRRKTDADVPQIAKSKRQAGETGQRARRLRGATPKIPSRPFRWS